MARTGRKLEKKTKNKKTIKGTKDGLLSRQKGRKTEGKDRKRNLRKLGENNGR